MSIKYRPEVDGLRSVAVIPVLFFHAGIFGFSGGFIGVDVFFVISGFLITGIIAKEISEGRFSIVDFYERRARRLMPALTVVLAVTTVAALLLMPPGFLKSYAQSLVAATLFLSNVFFYLTSGYFDTASEEKPLLHTWSLAIEEQFYVFFPILLLLLWRLGLLRVRVILCLLFVASLAAAEYLSDKSPNANFFLITTRAWELLAGSLVALLPVYREGLFNISGRLASGLAALGLAVIVGSFFVVDGTTPAPGLWTLPPVLGTAMLLYFARPENLAGKVLCIRPMVWIGLLSYPLYLWHQPVFALLRLRSVQEYSPLIWVAVILACIALSEITRRYIEAPIRYKTLLPGRRVLLATGAMMAFFVALGVLGHLSKGLPQRYSDEVVQIPRDNSPKRKACHTSGRNYLSPEESCTYSGENVSWAVFGNSHAVELAYALADRLEPRGEGLLHLSFSGCMPLMLNELEAPGCREWLQESQDYLVSQPSIRNVVLSFRHPVFLSDETLQKAHGLVGSGRNRYQMKDAYWQAFARVAASLKAAGKEVTVVAPYPELPGHVGKILYPISVLQTAPMVDPIKSVSMTRYQRRNQFFLAQLERAEAAGQFSLLKPTDALCDGDFCPSMKGAYPLYFDDNHLSVEGAKYLVDYWLK